MKNVGGLLKCQEALLLLPEIYQPVVAPGFSHLIPKRPCEDRLNLIIPGVDNSGARINDIGCQIGYFSFLLARKGHLVTGFDMNEQNINVCNLINEINGISPKPKFLNIAFDLETAEKFKTVDYTLCLAVFHHIIHTKGISVAKKLVPILRKKTKKKLFFEIGQSNEPVEPWTRSLPDMGTDPFTWISDFLKEGGFRNIKSLGRVATHVSEIPRYLIVAE